jgi:hypothetical protein
MDCRGRVTDAPAVTTAWTVAFIALAVVTAFLAVGVLGLARYVAAIAARLPDALPLELHQGPEVGSSITSTADRIDSVVRGFTGSSGNSMIVFLTNTCSACAEVGPALDQFARIAASDLSLVAVVSGADVDGSSAATFTHRAIRVVLDEDNAISVAFGISKVPFALFYQGGTLRAKGVVNSLLMLENLTEGKVRGDGDELLKARLLDESEDGVALH